MSKTRPIGRVFSIPSGASFSRTFVERLLGGDIIAGFPGPGDTIGLARATILVPTRRAARALADEFVRASGRRAALLPRIAPLGRLDALDEDRESGSISELSGDLPINEVSEIERRLVLMELVRDWSDKIGRAIVSVDGAGKIRTHEAEPILIGASLASAWTLAGELASLIDEFLIEGVEWTALAKINPEEFDSYWGITQRFLSIAAEMWPAHLAERGMVDRAALLSRLADREIERFAADVSSAPLIVAGSTGANPVTARLLAAIATRPNGAVVLPGLDFHLDDRSWSVFAGDETADAEPAFTHPQSAMARLLKSMRKPRSEVIEIGVSDTAARGRFLSEAFRPAETTDVWSQLRTNEALRDFERGLEGLTIVEAADEREEALCVAIKLRACLEQEGSTAAFVTPDRDIARRVRAQLSRWGLEIDDSAGDPLGRSPWGAFARLLLDAAASDAAGIDLIGLLSHPLARFGFEPVELDRLARLLNIGTLRASSGSPFIVDEFIGRARKASEGRDAHPNTKLIGESDWAAIRSLLERVEQALLPLRPDADLATISDWARWHRTALSAASDMNSSGGGAVELEHAFAQLIEFGHIGARIDYARYAAFFETMIADTPVRPAEPADARLRIFGLLEARLLDFDTIMVAGLDEGSWPPKPRTDPFLNRSMRASLGMSPPERRIGQTAHDLSQLLGAREVVIVRTIKRDGAPTVPSRFIQRMAALAGTELWTSRVERGAELLSWARRLDPRVRSRIAPPTPRPPIALRPLRLSVTRIETLRRDPYSIFAESVLRLTPLESIDMSLGARDFGVALHDVVAEFSRPLTVGRMKVGDLSDLVRIGQARFQSFFDLPGFRQFAWPRLKQTLAAYHAWETARAPALRTVLLEKAGLLKIPLADGSLFELTARADRIESHADGSQLVLDFKSGSLPTIKEIRAGFAPQLVLEARMLAAGGFGVTAGREGVSATYVKLGGSKLLETRSIGADDDSVDQLAEEQFDGLLTLLNQLRMPQTPFPSRPYPQFVSRFGAYDHLARVKEWSAAGDTGDGG